MLTRSPIENSQICMLRTRDLWYIYRWYKATYIYILLTVVTACQISNYLEVVISFINSTANYEKNCSFTKGIE